MTIYSNFFSYIPFWHQKYIIKYLKPNLIYCSVFFFFRDAGFRMDSLFSILKIYRVLLNFHSLHIYIDPEQLYVINIFKELFIFVC